MVILDNETKQVLKNGFIWNSINRLGTLGIQFISILILSRLLSKEDFALMGIVSFFITISNIMIDSGMGGSLIGAKNVSRVDYSTLFIYNLAISATLCFLLIVCSSIIADFYNIQDLVPILYVIGISIVISSLGKVQYIILVREFKFKILGKISLISSVISLTVAVALAFMGYGVWALVIQNVIFNLCIVLLQFCYNRFIPSLIFSKESFKGQWVFGMHLFFSQSLQTIYNNIFLAIFPKISSLSFAGLYSQASKLQQLPIGVFNTILDGASFPILTKMEDQDQFKETDRKIASRFYLITFAVFLLLSLLAKPLIAIVLGEKWIDASPLLSILSIAGIFYMIMTVARNTLKSLRKTKIISQLEIYKTVIGIIILLISILYGNYGIILGILLAAIISTIITLFVLAKNTSYTIKEQLADISSPLFVLLPGYVFSFLLLENINVSYIISLVIGLSCCTIFIVLMGFVTRNAIIINYLISFISNGINLLKKLK